MRSLLYKEFKLAVHPTAWIFLSFVTMLLIPNYPYYAAFFYLTLGLFFTFVFGNTNNDVYFTTLLPIRKRDVVKARVLTIVIFELTQILLSIPFAFLRYRLTSAENLAGMEANPALYGLVFGMFGVFNAVFLPGFYKTGRGTGIPFLFSCAAMLLFTAAAEAVIHLVPGWAQALDTLNRAYLPQQVGVLAAGISSFILLTLLAYRLSARRFETLDL